MQLQLFALTGPLAMLFGATMTAPVEPDMKLSAVTNTTRDTHVVEPREDSWRLFDRINTLPKCYLPCFDSEKGYWPYDMTQESLDDWCHKHWFFTVNWIDYHLSPCIDNSCSAANEDPDETAIASREWMLKNCGF